MIKITNLNKYFYRKKSNEIHVINDVSLQFPETGLVTILGESGSGKTTLMNVLGGLDDFESGTIEYDNQKINKYSAKKMDKIRNDKIGYIFQNYLLLQQRTSYDNLKLMLNMYDISEQEKEERIDYVLEAVGMSKYKKKNVSELSGGQQQRIAIARALIKSPTLILADEPTGNLDEKNTIQIMNIIKKISKNTLVILVSHEKSIATSYSDYIIEVSDGKVVNKGNVSNQTIYKYEDDQNIYLKEYKHEKIENDVANIDFYSNDKEKINLKVVFKNGKFYIHSTNDVILLDENSETKLVDDYKQELDTSSEINESNYELKPLVSNREPSLTFKEKIKLTFSNLAKMKKRTRFLAFPLILIAILTMLVVQSVVSAAYIDKQHLVYEDSRIYNISFDKGFAGIDKEVYKFGYEHFYEGLKKENPTVEPVLNTSVRLQFSLPNFTQLSNVKYNLENCSTLPLEVLDEDSLIYGEMPSNATEVVVEKWVLENAIESSTLQNIMDINSFVGKKITMVDKTFTFTISGVADNDQNSMYLNKWALINIYPSDIKKSGVTICSVSELEKYLGEKVNIEVGSNQGLVNSLNEYNYEVDDLLVNYDKRIQIDILNKYDFKDCPFDFAIDDNAYDAVLKSVLSYNYEKLDVFYETEEELASIKKYIEEHADYYNSGELHATKENGYVNDAPIHSTEVKIIIKGYSTYEDKLAPYIEESKQAVESRVLITVMILLVSIIIVFFAMKSYAIKNIYDIGVYRAIGIKKGSIAFVYALETLIISLQTTLIGGLLCYAITNFIASIPLISVSIAISFPMFVYVTFGLIVLNVIVGVIPVMLYMRLTPSKILTKYDI